MIAQRDQPTGAQKARIRQNVEARRLPHAVGAYAVISPSGETSGRVAWCDACGEPGAVRVFARLRWHDACFAFWQAVTARIDN